MNWHLGYVGSLQTYIAIYHGDGTVACSHGGIECGQGMNTKVAQVIAHTLNVPLDKVFVRPTNDLIGANSAVTGGSSRTDMVCFVRVLLEIYNFI